MHSRNYPLLAPAVFLMIIVAFATHFAAPKVFGEEGEPPGDENIIAEEVAAPEPEIDPDPFFEEAKRKIAEPDRRKLGETHRLITAFTSRKGETDNTECDAAAGNICNAWKAGRKYTMCATRAFPLGTILKVELDRLGFRYRDFPDGYLLCEVVDRMAPQHPQGIDIYFGEDGPVCRNTYARPPKGKCLNFDEAFTINYTGWVEAYEGDGPVRYH